MKIMCLVHQTTLGIAMIGVAVTVSVGCSRSPNPLAPTTAVEAQNAFSTAPDLGPELSAVREATDQFHDVTAALAAGYVSPAGRPCEQTASGAMGIHSPNRALQTSQVLDPLHPEVLLYVPKPGGDFGSSAWNTCNSSWCETPTPIRWHRGHHLRHGRRTMKS